MKKNTVKKIALCTLSFVTLSLGFTGCKDYLTEIEPGTTLLGDYFTGAGTECDGLLYAVDVGIQQDLLPRVVHRRHRQ